MDCLHDDDICSIFWLLEDTSLYLADLDEKDCSSIFQKILGDKCIDEKLITTKIDYLKVIEEELINDNKENFGSSLLQNCLINEQNISLLLQSIESDCED